MADMYTDLCERILAAQEEMLKHEVEANTVVLNGKKYAKLMKPGYRPTIFGMALEVDRSLPDDWDFIVQCREPQLATNADRIRAMSDEDLAETLCRVETDGRAYGPSGKADWLEWLKSPAGGD